MMIAVKEQVNSREVHKKCKPSMDKENNDLEDIRVTVSFCFMTCHKMQNNKKITNLF